MTRIARIEPEAEIEFKAASEWYEEQKPGLGHSFVAAVDEAIARIVAMPEAASPVVGVDLPVRRVFIKRFPYSIVFLPIADEIVVVAISHMKREPNYWISRIPDQ